MTPKPPWRLTREAMDHFLARLDPDRDQAGARYEVLRAKLITFFLARGCAQADELADETLDRVIRRLAEIDIANLNAFALGVARHVASEQHKKPQLRELDWDPPAPAPADPRPKEALLDCLERSLRLLPGEDHDLILDYYQFDKRRKIDARQGWARRLGLSETALRVRAFRLRRKLEEGVEDCMRRKKDAVTFRAVPHSQDEGGLP